MNVKHKILPMHRSDKYSNFSFGVHFIGLNGYFRPKGLMKLRTLVVDDERLARENLNSLLLQYCSEQVGSVTLASSADEAVDLLMTEEFDVLFLDIKMPDLDGFELLKKVEFLNPRPQVIFVTAYTDFGIQAVKVSALDYITKPIDPLDLRNACNRAHLNKSGEGGNYYSKEIKTKIGLPLTNGLEVLELDDIVRLEADGCYTLLVLSSKDTRLVSKTLKEFEKKLPEEFFFRLHNSHMINMNFMNSFTTEDGGSVLMINGERIPISKRRLLEFRKKLNEFCVRPGT